MRYRKIRIALLLLAAATTRSGSALAAIDHELNADQSGIWGRKYQTGLEFALIATEAGGALWFGKDEPLGRTFWQAVDASVISGLGAQGLKRIFGRARPDQGGDPNSWFRGSCCQSFPSGEVALQASFVTPFVVDYARDHPWIWAPEALPLYDAIARLKSQAHWQSDLIAGWMLGSAVGYWSARRAIPLTVQVLPAGLSVGWSKQF